MVLSVTNNRKHLPKSRPTLSLEVTAMRRSVYRVDMSGDGDGSIRGEGDERPIGPLDPLSALRALFELRYDRWQWYRREVAKSDVASSKTDLGRLAMPRGLPKDIVKLGDPAACRSAKRKYERALKLFLREHGPLVDSENRIDFAEAMEDIFLWSQRARGSWLRFNPDNPTGALQIASRAAAVERIQKAIQSVVPGADGVKRAPTLYAALCYAIEWSQMVGIRFFVCENASCDRTFTPERSTAQYCSDACRKAANRRTRD
jgi:hypothetical protein